MTDTIRTDTIRTDAIKLRKLIREAEALADESMIAFARLKQAMLAARQNPEVEVDTGQRALMRLNQAEAHAMSMSTSLLRVHAELSNVAREKMGGDVVPTVIEGANTSFEPVAENDPALETV